MNVTTDDLFAIIGAKTVENAKFVQAVQQLQQQLAAKDAELANKDALIAELQKRPETPAPGG